MLFPFELFTSMNYISVWQVLLCVSFLATKDHAEQWYNVTFTTREVHSVKHSNMAVVQEMQTILNLFHHVGEPVHNETSECICYIIKATRTQFIRIFVSKQYNWKTTSVHHGCFYYSKVTNVNAWISVTIRVQQPYHWILFVNEIILLLSWTWRNVVV